jgi:hypothetical protein
MVPQAIPIQEIVSSRRFPEPAPPYIQTLDEHRLRRLAEYGDSSAVKELKRRVKATAISRSDTRFSPEKQGQPVAPVAGEPDRSAMIRPGPPKYAETGPFEDLWSSVSGYVKDAYVNRESNLLQFLRNEKTLEELQEMADMGSEPARQVLAERDPTRLGEKPFGPGGPPAQPPGLNVDIRPPSAPGDFMGAMGQQGAPTAVPPPPGYPAENPQTGGIWRHWRERMGMPPEQVNPPVVPAPGSGEVGAPPEPWYPPTTDPVPVVPAPGSGVPGAPPGPAMPPPGPPPPAGAPAPMAPPMAMPTSTAKPPMPELIGPAGYGVEPPQAIPGPVPDTDSLPWLERGDNRVNLRDFSLALMAASEPTPGAARGPSLAGAVGRAGMATVAGSRARTAAGAKATAEQARHVDKMAMERAKIDSTDALRRETIRQRGEANKLSAEISLMRADTSRSQLEISIADQERKALDDLREGTDFMLMEPEDQQKAENNVFEFYDRIREDKGFKTQRSGTSGVVPHTATNRETGERMIWRDGKWVPM